jgi:hypothetical protein
LRIPTSLFESALADVVVVGGTGVPGSGTHVFAYIVGVAPAAANARNIGVAGVEKAVEAPASRLVRQRAVGDVNDVAVVVDASFDEQVRIDRSAYLMAAEFAGFDSVLVTVL